MVVEERNKVLREEQWIATTCPGILYGSTVTYGDRAVFQNQLYRYALPGLTYGVKPLCYWLPGIKKTVVTRSVFYRLLVIEIE
ncbi:hypothetical protein AWF55_22715 [Escherichia coli]|nr:hypothetical protein AWF55_22715 [Escherichia coli]KZJ95877.1 hypothetical protein AWG97_03965 [Escherichia coli]